MEIILTTSKPKNLEYTGVRKGHEVMLKVLLDRQDIVHYEFIPEGKIVNKEMYTDILSRLKDAVRRKCPHNGEPTVGFSFTTMLQHTDRFWSRIFQQRTM